ncbi:hypothetical protein B0H12DRAFT_98265 [Mycena haematopus]|nr:hypothetical protein B0H12DRAFT_98265 [Mycena haematopus]
MHPSLPSRYLTYRPPHRGVDAAFHLYLYHQHTDAARHRNRPSQISAASAPRGLTLDLKRTRATQRPPLTAGLPPGGAAPQNRQNRPLYAFLPIPSHYLTYLSPAPRLPKYSAVSTPRHLYHRTTAPPPPPHRTALTYHHHCISTIHRLAPYV